MEEAVQWGKFNNEPIEEGTLKDRIEKLKRLAGKLTWRMSLPATGNKQLLMFQLHIPMAGHEAKPLRQDLPGTMPWPVPHVHPAMPML